MVYAARHYRELSAQNELRPQDVMRILVHYHAYGDATKVSVLVESHSVRIRKEITRQEEEEVERLQAEYQDIAEKLEKVDKAIPTLQVDIEKAKTKAEAKTIHKRIENLEKQRPKLVAKVAERDERIAETRSRADGDRGEVIKVGEELIELYRDANELIKHSCVAILDDITQNEFNLNIPRYVDTFEPEPRIQVTDALQSLSEAEALARKAEAKLRGLLKELGYAI